MTVYLITDDDTVCVACEAFAHGDARIDLTGEPSKPLCRKHFNEVLKDASWNNN